ncbi:MAG: RNA-guided pseudouridylation complex pseudouridine synthase subunit Cbf5 [Candidatus Bathyarchaeota archaeon]|nr:MAG: RNA-guided pseudouridylation complex pseudouridine synthase subunit Cbf5 [Candidatus Bathyarchaeota archaeon]
MGVIPPWEVERTVVTRAFEDTNPSLGTPPDQRPLQQHIKYGVLVLDKQAGPTSHEVVSWVKKLLELDRAGHGGTLDPKVTGVLPIGLQESTKVVQALLESGKEYICVMRTHREENEGRVLQNLRMFEGEIYQRPPVRSSVRRRLRTRTIYRIDYLEGDGRNWLFKVACESGTYIRKLCYDVGEVLGGGAHMHELRRTRSGPFTEDDVVTMYDLSEALDLFKEEGDETMLRMVIRPLEDALGLLPKIWIRDSAVDALCNGAALAMPGVLGLSSGIEGGAMVAVMTSKGEGVALMRAEASTVEIGGSEHGIAARPVRVIMPRGTYPKMW